MNPRLSLQQSNLLKVLLILVIVPAETLVTLVTLVMQEEARTILSELVIY